jgi:hypothetical protein
MVSFCVVSWAFPFGVLDWFSTFLWCDHMKGVFYLGD